MNIVLSNVPAERADELARIVVEERLAACVNALPVRSTYRWKGSVQIEAEVTLLMKVSRERTARLVERLRALHPYELPEVLVVPVDAAASLGAYVAWVRSECEDQQ